MAFYYYKGFEKATNVGHQSMVISKVGWLACRKHGMKTRLPGALERGHELLLQVGLKWTCMGKDLTYHASGRSIFFLVF